MPTRNRRRFVAQSIWYFLRQDYKPCELVIVDDGEDAIHDLVPKDERIHYVHLSKRMPLGAKRNLACEMSRGELIAHWDDDDWVAPHRLSKQVHELQESNADACGVRDLLHFSIESGEAWLYRYPPQERPWLAGGTLLYRSETWREHRFPEINVGEDNAFVWQLPGHKLHPVQDLSLYIALIHAGNSAYKNFEDPRWQKRPLEEVSQFINFDREFYVALRNGNSKKSMQAPPMVTSITLCAPFMVYDGYGSMAEHLAVGMSRTGADVNLIPLGIDLTGTTDEFQQIVKHSRPEPDAPVLYFSWPRDELNQFQNTRDLFINTMWESNRLPADWPARMNRSRTVIVPTRYVANVCRESSITVPIEVVPEGIDPALYHYQERPERQTITTLIVGPVVKRKHTREAITAWQMAFDDDPDARLIIKSRFDYGNYRPDDPRIIFVSHSEPTRGILHWYRQADILLALGSEGFGLPLIEGMSTGLPCVALNAEGQSDVCADLPHCILRVEPDHWEECDEAPFGRVGVRAIPSIEQSAAHLRWIAKHRNEAREMGQAASEWVIVHRNIWDKAPRVLTIMEQHLEPARPLHRTRTIWVPSWQSPCGLAEHTLHLSEAMGHIRVTARAPELRAVRTLLIQHENSLFNDTQLTQYVQSAREARVPVVITEHSVKQSASAWERDADVLLALTQHGTAILRDRWPAKDVRYMPLGCPTWFPPRKQTSGKVIGVFGFLEPHKGFWQLLHVLPTILDAELLMFSYPKSPEMRMRWEHDAQGLSVRHVSEFLPEHEVAQRLAAEADILVFWYDEIQHASASAAARIGLATGVPMLTSPTSWFRDLREVTFQPDNLLEGIQHLWEDTTLRTQLTGAAREYCEANSWQKVAEQHVKLCQELER
jgi:glycosyltransferase involved in cell wall biosynthesis